MGLGVAGGNGRPLPVPEAVVRKAAALGYGDNHGLYGMYTMASARFAAGASAKIDSLKY